MVETFIKGYGTVTKPEKGKTTTATVLEKGSLLDCYLGQLQNLFNVDENQPGVILHSTDGYSKWRKGGWFTMVGEYADSTLEECGVFVTGVEETLEKRGPVSLPEIYERIGELELHKGEKSEIYIFKKSW